MTDPDLELIMLALVAAIFAMIWAAVFIWGTRP